MQKICFTHAARLLAPAMALILAGCQDEDFGYDIADVRSKAYVQTFKDVFGDIDPNQDWSMAQNVRVRLHVPNATGYGLRILTEAPTNRGAILLYSGQMTSDQTTVSVDLIRGTEKLYVELKSELGTRLVDGYYYIDEMGNVEVDKVGTRFTATAPALENYTQTIRRWARIWDTDRAVSSPYRWDWGFAQSVTRLVSGQENHTPDGWRVTYDGSNRMPGSDSYSGGPRLLNINGESTAFGRKVSQSLFLRQTGTVAQYGGFDGKYLYISSGPTIMHFAFAKRKNRQDAINITMVRVDSNGNEVVEKEQTFANFPSNDPGDGSAAVAFNDKSFEFTAKGGRYIIRMEVTIGINSEGTSFAGFQVEAKDSNSTYGDKYAFHTYDESVSGYISYRDVRGGAVNRWLSSQYLQLRNEPTYRNNQNNDHFQYRTYDVERMVDANGNSQISEGVMGPFYIIQGGDGEAIREDYENVMYRDIFALYGMYKSTKTETWKGAPFREGVNHIDPFFTDGNFHTATELEMAHDAQIVTLGAINTEKVQYDGTVSIKLVGKGTDHGNDVGYFYYPKSEEDKVMDVINGEKTLNFNKVPKIIIRKGMEQALEGQGVSNLTSSDNLGAEGRLWSFQFNRYVDGCSALSLSQEERDELKASDLFKTRYDKDEYGVRTFITGLEANPSRIAKAADATFRAPIYKLPYYGWDYSQSTVNPMTSGTATYEWPKDMVIGFFGIRTDDDAAAELSRIYTSSASVQRNYFNDLPRGSAFSYKGKNYIGLEDEWDYDNNDFLFEVQGVHSVDPDITPEDDVTTVKNVQNWIVACEDLGGVWDYDFNDLIWAVSKEVSTTTTVSGTTGEVTETGMTDIYFQALAAGGTLEAIVEYNTSIALGPDDSGWDNNAWIQIGEIHKLVSRDDNAQTTGEGAQLNVWDIYGVTKDNIGNRIKIGATIPTNSSDINVTSILKHFRIRVKGENGEYVVTSVTKQTGANHKTHAGEVGYNANATNAPQFLLLPSGWAWPAEGVCINDVYGLTDWVQDSNPNWYWYWRNSSAGHNGKYILNPLEYTQP